MNIRKLSVSTVLLLLLSVVPAFAWPTCKGQWVSVPKGTTGGTLYSTGDLLFQCQTTPPPSSNPTSSNSSSSSSSSSNSNSGASSNSGAKATGGKSSSSSGVSNSGNSTSSSGVSNSGNSSNNNRNTATGGKGGDASQQQSQSSAITNSGNNAAYSNETNIAAPKIPVDTAYAPNGGTTVTCFKGYGAGVQTMPVGISLGGGKIDPNCAVLEAARQAPSKLARCKVYISNKYVRQAGVTLDDCMGASGEPPIVQQASPVTMIVGQNSPVAAVAPPAPPVMPDYNTEITVTPEEKHLVGICTFAKDISCKGPYPGPAVVTVSSICKQMLEAAKRELVNNPNAILYVIGNRNNSETTLTAEARANNVRRYLTDSGIKAGKIDVSVGTGTARTVELWSGPKQ